jgi:hypothetical protein
MAMQKKAKLAHEKRASQSSGDVTARFHPTTLVEPVTTTGGETELMVDLGAGQRGIISSMYGHLNKETGAWSFKDMAIPATYDDVARARAIERFETHMKAQA